MSELPLNGIQLISYCTLGTSRAALESEGRISDSHPKKRPSKGRLAVRPRASSSGGLAYPEVLGNLRVLRAASCQLLGTGQVGGPGPINLAAFARPSGFQGANVLGPLLPKAASTLPVITKPRPFLKGQLQLQAPPEFLLLPTLPYTFLKQQFFATGMFTNGASSPQGS